MSFPTTDLGAGLALRAWQLGDAPDLSRIANDIEVWRHMSDRFPHPYTPDIARYWVEHGHINFGGDNYAVVLHGALVGGAGIYQGSGDARCNAEIGYWYARNAWGTGIGTRVAAALTEMAFARALVSRVFAPVHAGNPASMRVLKKCGFEREGVQRLSAFKGEQLVDRVFYARYREPST